MISNVILYIDYGKKKSLDNTDKVKYTRSYFMTLMDLDFECMSK